MKIRNEDSVEHSLDVVRLDAMVRGWFVGDFAPAAYRTKDIEVAVQQFVAGSIEPAHVHLKATEITLLLQGRCRMAGRELSAGDIITLPPGVVSDFEALEACITVVVKHPSVLNDKFVVNEC